MFMYYFLSIPRIKSCEWGYNEQRLLTTIMRDICSPNNKRTNKPWSSNEQKVFISLDTVPVSEYSTGL